MIEIVEAAIANTVQDTGRSGFYHLGVGRSGAMDGVALQLGNIMLGNPPDAAAVEVQMFPFAVRFLAPAGFAVTGSDCAAALDGVTLPPWWATAAQAGQVLRLQAPADGARSYLALAGGVDVPMVLGSRSTHLRSGFGGFQGRALQDGDRLPIGPARQAAITLGVNPPQRTTGSVRTVRAMGATELHDFPIATQQAFWSAAWRVTAQSNRHGYRLSGPELPGGEALSIRSTPILPGVVQLPPGGAPIVQMSDANTAGGYPKMATVIAADLPLLGQARLGSYVRFQRTDHAAGLAAEREVQSYLAQARRIVGLYRDANTTEADSGGG